MAAYGALAEAHGPRRGSNQPDWVVVVGQAFSLPSDPGQAGPPDHPVPLLSGRGSPSPAQLAQIAASLRPQRSWDRDPSGQSPPHGLGGHSSVYGYGVSANFRQAWAEIFPPPAAGSAIPASPGPQLRDLCSLGHLLLPGIRPPDLDRLLKWLRLPLPSATLEERARSIAAAVPKLVRAVQSLPLAIRLECRDLGADLGWPDDPAFHAALSCDPPRRTGEVDSDRVVQLLTPRGRLLSILAPRPAVSEAEGPVHRKPRHPEPGSPSITEETKRFFEAGSPAGKWRAPARTPVGRPGAGAPTCLGGYPPKGPLAIALQGFEDRPSQRALAEAVARTLVEGRVLCTEAGTGVGKTMAYLVPAILWARATGERVAISTATKHLQDQIFLKDLPTVQAALAQPVKVAVVKGRGNYLCVRKLLHLYLEAQGPGGESTRTALLPLLAWASGSDELDLTEFGELEGPSPLGPDWPLGRLASDAQSCPQRSCPLSETCALERLRRRVQRAQVVILNHALLCSGTRAGSLADFAGLILDEAHSLEDIIADQFGITVDARAIRARLRRVTGTDAFSLVRRMSFFLAPQGPSRRSAAAERGRRPRATREMEAIVLAARAVEEAIRACANTWHRLEDALSPNARGRQGGRIRLQSEFLASGKGQELVGAASALAQALEGMAKALGGAAKSIGSAPTLHTEDRTSLAAEARSLADEFRSLSEATASILDLSSPGVVSWGEGIRSMDKERGASSEVAERGDSRFVIRHSSFTFGQTPLNVGDILCETFLRPSKAAVLCSGTLTVGGRADFFVDRLGLASLGDRLEVEVFPSDYDLRQQVLVCAARDLPDPGTAGWEPALATAVGAILTSAGSGPGGQGRAADVNPAADAPGRERGGALVLFTSRQTLERVYALAKPELEAAGLPVLCQYLDGSRTGLWSALMEGSATGLFATRSFFEGVDLPGEALEVLVMTRLPFPVPTDALIEARCQQIAEAGGDPMIDYTLPLAVIWFRQALGRLVRSRHDRGVLVVLDGRILRRGYGRAFLESMPEPTFFAGDLGAIIGQIRQWMAHHRKPMGE